MLKGHLQVQQGTYIVDGIGGILVCACRDYCGEVPVEPIQVGIGIFRLFVDYTAGQPEKRFAVRVGVFLIFLCPVDILNVP